MFSKELRLYVMLLVNLGWTLPALPGKKACSCYSFHGDLRPWYLSRQHCLDNGGDLVSLETTEEWSGINDEIQHKTTDRLGDNEWHIGLTNLTGVWRWVNNKTLTYDRWQDGEPEFVTNKPFVVMAKDWPKGTQGLFNSLREDIPRARICEYKRSCVSIKETCRKLTARTAGFAVTTPKTMRLSTASFSTYMRKRTTPQYKTDPVLNGENPTSKPNSKAKEKKPFYIVVVIIILGTLIFCCCCIVIVAFRRKKKRKKEKSKEDDKTNNEAAIKTHDSSARSSDSDEFDDSQQEAREKDLSNCLNESNVAISYTNSRDDYTAVPLRHEYAEIMIIKDDDNGGGDECDGRERATHRVRFDRDENERLKNESIRNGKRNHSTNKGYNSNGNYLVENCKKHHGNKKNGSPETTSPPTVNYKKLKGLLKINENNEPQTVEREQQEENHMEIVKLDIAIPAKEAQYASIVEIHAHEHDSIINKKPFLKTFAPVNGYRHQNVRNFEGYEQNETNNEQNSRDFEHYEQNGRIFDQCEQNGRNCDERDLYTSVDKSVQNKHTRPHEAVYAVVDKSKKTNKKAAYSNVRMNYVELADFDKNAALYTKMPPRYQPTRYAEVEIPIEWD